MKTSGGSAVYKGWDYRVVKNKMDESEDASHINEGISCPVANNFDDLVKQLEEMLQACKRPAIDYNTGEQEKD